MTPKPPTTWITYVLIAANVAVFAVTAALGAGLSSPDPDRLVAFGGSLPALTLSGEPWRLATAMFLHAGILHVAMNMFALASGGRAAETILGRTSYLAVYLVSGLVGGVATLVKTAMVVTVGASGAVFGVFGALFAYVVAHRAQLDPEVRARQMKSMATFVGLNLFIGLTVPAISLAAHVGGFAVGFLVVLFAERGIDISDPPAAARRRLPRVAIATVLALAVGGAGLVLLPKSPVAYATKADLKKVELLQEKFQKFVTAEKQLLEQQKQAAERAQKGEITAAEEARILREDLVPSWRWQRTEIASVKDLPAAIAPRQQAILAYLDARIEHVEVLAKLVVFEDDTDPAAAAAIRALTEKQKALDTALENVNKAFAAP